MRVKIVIKINLFPCHCSFPIQTSLLQRHQQQQQRLMIQTNRMITIYCLIWLKSDLDQQVKNGNFSQYLPFVQRGFNGFISLSLSLFPLDRPHWASETHTLTASSTPTAQWHWLLLLALFHGSEPRSEGKIAADSVWFLSTFRHMIQSTPTPTRRWIHVLHLGSAQEMNPLLTHLSATGEIKLNMPHSVLSVSSHRRLY